jgi:biopolymer transport protein ExbD
MGMQVGGSDEGVKSEPNVVPMIDIMLVLLIIFMIVTPVISSGFQAEMPLDPGTGEIGVVPFDQLEDVLRQVFEYRTKDKILYFRADQSLEFSHVSYAIETARAAGVRVLAAVMDQKREGRGGILGGVER